MPVVEKIHECQFNESVVFCGNFTNEIGMYECDIRFYEKCKLGYLHELKVKYFSLFITKVSIWSFSIRTFFQTVLVKLFQGIIYIYIYVYLC